MTQTSAIPEVAERPAPDATLDTSGLLCPLPVYKASLALNGLTAGQVLELVTTDPGSLADIPALATRMREAGLDVAVEIDEVDLPGNYQLTVYRIVQESLTNVLRHSSPGVTASVRVYPARTTLVVEVRDTGTPRRSISSARTVRNRSTVSAVPSSSVAPWWIHCHASDREISTVAASSIRS